MFYTITGSAVITIGLGIIYFSSRSNNVGMILFLIGLAISIIGQRKLNK